MISSTDASTVYMRSVNVVVYACDIRMVEVARTISDYYAPAH